MTKWLNAFLEFKNEASGTRAFALLAVVVITVGLASLSVTGIIATAKWNLMSALPTFGLILAVLGAEALATVAFIRTLTAPTRLRKVAGFLIFLGLAAIGVHNAENGAHVVWPDRFAESSSSLSAKADLAGNEATKLGEAQDTASKNSGSELERVRTQIADLRVEQRKMAAQSPEGIKEAQALLLAQGKYYGRVDGIRQNLTEAAMRARGEEIQGELAILMERESGLMAGSSPVQQATTDKSLLKIENEEKARAAFWAWFWLILMLCTLEGARSLSLWALITNLTGAGTDLDRQREEELRAEEHQNRLADLRAQRAKEPPPEPEPGPASHPEPVEAVSPPEPLPPPPQPEPSQQQIWGREGGKQAAHNRRAEQARNSRVLIIGPVSTLDALKVAAE